MYKKIDNILFIFLVLLMIFNIVILFSATNKNINIVNRTIIHILISFILMILSSLIKYETYEKFSPILYIISVFMLIFTYFFGNSSKGAYRWIKIYNFKFQPSELSKISVPLITSYIIKKYGCPNSIKSLIFVLIIIFIPSVLVAIQPDLGTSILIIFSGLSVLFMSGIDYNKLFFIGLIMSFIFFINWNFFMKKYQKNRILVLFNPKLSPYGIGYHIIQSKIAIGSGGVFGKGLFNGTQSKLKFIPESHTDFIFSVVAEEFGFLGSLFLIFLYLGFIFRGLFFVINNRNIFSKILISSFILTISFSILLNIGMVIGLLPVVGIPLPLISYGGSSLSIILIKIGIIISMSCNNDNIYKF